MMQLVCCTADPERAIKAVHNWVGHAFSLPPFLFVSDGVPPVREVTIERVESGLHVLIDASSVAIPKSGPVGALQAGYLNADPSATILAYIHDDVVIHEDGWDQRVLKEFDDPQVAVVGFGGATGLGMDSLYKTPYRLQQLARERYASNVDDAEVHGERFTGERDVAVLDGFCQIVRKSFLDEIGGWPTAQMLFHCYDTYICCCAAEKGYKVRLVGVRCHHQGGQTSTKSEYNNWIQKTHGRTDAEEHTRVHAFIYERFRSVLPIRR